MDKKWWRELWGGQEVHQPRPDDDQCTEQHGAAQISTVRPGIAIDAYDAPTDSRDEIGEAHGSDERAQTPPR